MPIPRGMQRAAEHIFCFACFACANCYLSGVPDHLPLLDIGCAFGLAWATQHLSRAGGSTSVRAAMTLMAMRWVSSVGSVLLAPALDADVKRFVVLVQAAAFGTLVLV